MLKFISSVAKGLVAAGIILAAASILIPARPQIAPIPAAVGDIEPKDLAAPANEGPAPPVAQEALLDPNPQVADSAAQAPAQAVPDQPEPALAAPEPMIAAPAVPEPETPAIAAPEVAAPEVAAPEVAAPQVIAPDTSGGVPAPLAADTQVPQEAAAPLPVIADPVAPDAPAPDLPPPLQRYAASFDDPGTTALYAVILHDTGGADVDRAALAALPFPVTFAIDPETPNATEMMAIYRAAGKEVVMLVAGLPSGATAQDLEQSFQTYQAILPETVAVMGPAQGGFQSSAVLAKLIVPVIAAQGRGMITFDRGLNSAAQVAQREALPQAVIFRQIDANGESVTVIRRYLTRGTFKAKEEASLADSSQRGAIVMGQTLPDTITALLEWSVESMDGDFMLAPVSALLK